MLYKTNSLVLINLDLLGGKFKEDIKSHWSKKGLKHLPF